MTVRRLPTALLSRGWRIPLLLVLGLLLMPSAGRAQTLQAQWDFDSENTGDATTDCFNPGPRSPARAASDICYYYATPDSAHRYDIGPAYPQTHITFQVGKWGNELSPNNDWMLQRGGTQALKPGRVSVVAWVHHLGNPGPYQYIAAQGAHGCAGASYALYTGHGAVGATPAAGLAFYITNGGGTAVVSPEAGDRVWDGYWHLVVGTFDGTKVHLYVDGFEVGTGTGVAPGEYINYLNEDDSHFVVDGYYPAACGNNQTVGSSGKYAGGVESLRVYARALSPSEITRLQNDSGGNSPPVLRPDPAILHTTSVDSITDTSATVHGTLDDRGDTVPWDADYGTSTTPDHGTQTQYSAGTIGPYGSVTVPISQNLPALQPATTYYVRLIAFGGGSGEQLSFRTTGGGHIHMGSGTATVGESDGSVSLTVQRTGTTSNTATVNYATADGSAQAGSDYTAKSGTLTFAPGEATKTIQIPIVSDSVVDGDKTFGVNLTSGNGANVDSPAASTVTIVDDDQTPIVRMDGATASTSEAGGSVAIGVRRTGNTAGSSSITYATADGTAHAGADFTARSGTLTFAPGETTKSISVPVLDDDLVEADESFYVSLSGPNGATLGSPSLTTVTIADDDHPPATTITLDPAAPGASGFYEEPVKVTATGTGSAPLETRCVIDPASAPRVFADLPAGRTCDATAVSEVGAHNVYAASRNRAGTENVMHRSFKISHAPDTVILEGPRGFTSAAPRFRFSGSPGNPTFECAIDDQPFTGCTSPIILTGLSLGEHTFRVRAISPEGLPDPTPAARAFTLGERSRSESCIDTFWALHSASHPKTIAESLFGGNTGDCSVHFPDCPIRSRCMVSGSVVETDSDGARRLPYGNHAPVYPGGPRYAVSLSVFAAKSDQWSSQVPSDGYRDYWCNLESPDTEHCALNGSVSNVSQCSDCRALTGAFCFVSSPSEEPGLQALLDKYDDSWLAPDYSRREILCRASETVGPMPDQFGLVIYNTAFSALVSGAGTFTVKPCLPCARAVAAAAGGPLIRSATVRVRHAGRVRVNVRLTQRGSVQLRRRHRLTLRVRLTFRPRRGATVVETRRVTLTPRPRAHRLTRAERLAGQLARRRR